MVGGAVGHNIGRGPYKYHSTKVWLQLAQWFLRRRLKFTTYDGWTDNDGRQVMAKAHTFILGFYVKFVFQPIYTGYAN
jgi:hypothetical protein